MWSTRRNASMTTFPLTLCTGSITTATARGCSCSKLCCVAMSVPESQQPKPGWEWYHPTTISGRPVCRSISSISLWNAWSTASTLTPVPLCGMANTSATVTVYSSTNSPSISPITSIGTPARPCLSILRRARGDTLICSDVSGCGLSPPTAAIIALSMLASIGFRCRFLHHDSIDQR
ncbi:Os06g0703700 [Oryza sativa Japonica Group]|uniref:Os06g0703700 protein n=1 Tax=Oryza sativa subsp. japonica TaxID=39947 RepID=Q5Z815_ORYSJ|nr:unknown protein [Oryza sativa Japonica Group]BAF20415.1 Os06g0703700 [Oryza sativa Japonica Group]|eukprot:NP_001058501.1 Os06g0703700 [Oryza sativa Japonica Group]